MLCMSEVRLEISPNRSSLHLVFVALGFCLLDCWICLFSFHFHLYPNTDLGSISKSYMNARLCIL